MLRKGRAFCIAASLVTAGASPRAHSFTWTDPVITPNMTRIRTGHITELRTNINTVRTMGSCNIGPFAWADPAPIANVTRIRAGHVAELRSAIAAVYSFRGVPSDPHVQWTDLVLTPDLTKIRATHIAELRSAVDYAQSSLCACSPIDGGWSGWSGCSAACGGGTQTRTCANPPPSCGGAACSGPSSQSCNTQACCSCTSWVNGTCGAAGGCPPGQRRQTRTCAPAACDTTSRCVADPACQPKWAAVSTYWIFFTNGQWLPVDIGSPPNGIGCTSWWLGFNAYCPLGTGKPCTVPNQTCVYPDSPFTPCNAVKVRCQ